MILPTPKDRYDRDLEIERNRILEAADRQNLKRGVLLDGVAGPGAGWVLLHDETKAEPGNFDVAVAAYQEYEVQIQIVRGATAFPYLEVNNSATYRGATWRVGDTTTVSGRTWTSSGAFLDSTTGTATVNAVVRLRPNLATGRVSISGTANHDAASVGMTLGGEVVAESVSSIQVDNGAVLAGTGSRVVVWGRGPL